MRYPEAVVVRARQQSAVKRYPEIVVVAGRLSLRTTISGQRSVAGTD